MARLAQSAGLQNVRTSGVMASPPTITTTPLWSNSTAYTVGQKVVNPSGSGSSSVGYWYVVTTAGTSSASCCGPTGTGTGITDGTVVWNYVSSHPTNKYSANSSANSYLWNAGTGLAGSTGVVQFLGGVPSTNVATGCEATNTATVAGTQSAGGGRWNFITDSAYIVVRIFNVGTNSSYRVIVNGKYASLAATTLAPGAWGYLSIDFTSVGGRATREITIESESNTYFCGLDVMATETVTSSGVQPVLTAIGVGTSIMATAGADMLYNGWFPIFCDSIGVKNCVDLGIGGTGYLISTASGGALSRLSDVTNAVAANPNPIIIDENLINDSSFTAAQIQAACLAYMQALRAAVGPNVPIIEIGMWATNNNGSNWAVGVAAENAKKAAVAAMNDPMIFFIPLITANGGSLVTGTGTDQAPNGTGNSDIYLNGLSLPHPNTLGHALYAQFVVNSLLKLIGGNGY